MLAAGSSHGLEHAVSSVIAESRLLSLSKVALAKRQLPKLRHAREQKKKADEVEKERQARIAWLKGQSAKEVIVCVYARVYIYMCVRACVHFREQTTNTGQEKQVRVFWPKGRSTKKELVYVSLCACVYVCACVFVLVHACLRTLFVV